MAGTPEEYPESFSPSVFLDLPATPPPSRAQRRGEPGAGCLLGRPRAPFISRMLMEDDIDDNQCPDQPALLQVEQPYAQILSDAAAAVATAACCSSSAATNADGNGADTLSPCGCQMVGGRPCAQ
ncbi:unnamed protein product [Urochloa humidicola]